MPLAPLPPGVGDSGPVPFGMLIRLLEEATGPGNRPQRHAVQLESWSGDLLLEVGRDRWRLEEGRIGGRARLERYHHRSFDWADLDEPVLEEMLNPALVLSSLEEIHGFRKERGLLLVAAPRASGSGDCAAVVFPESRWFQAEFDPGPGVFTSARSLAEDGEMLEWAHLNWIGPLPVRRPSPLRNPGAARSWEAVFEVMSTATERLVTTPFCADFEGFLTTAGLRAVGERWRTERSRGFRTSKFSGGAEWRNPGWNPWLERPGVPDQDTAQVPFNQAVEMAGQLPLDARHASYERITWDGSRWHAHMLGPDGTSFFVRDGPFWWPRRSRTLDRHEPHGWMPYWSAMVPEMLDPTTLLSALHFETVARRGDYFQIVGRPRRVRLRPHPAVVHPDADR